MLPRNNITKKSSKNSNDQDSYKEFRENINTNVEHNSNKSKAHGFEHNKLPMKKLNVNNLIVNHNHNQLNVQRPTSYENHRRSPVVDKSSNAYHSNNQGYMHNNPNI